MWGLPSPIWEWDVTVQCLENDRFLTPGRERAALTEEKKGREDPRKVRPGVPSLQSPAQEVVLSKGIKGMGGSCPLGVLFTGTTALILY